MELVSDWNVWVSRRVDSFYFAGDDERQLHRHQSVDFKLPESMSSLDLPLLDGLGGFPVPLTFVRKWRLPQFSFRDRHGASVSLLQRQQSTRLAAAMLIALGTIVKNGSLNLTDSSTAPRMPEPLRRLLGEIASGEPTESVLRCVELRDPRQPAAKSVDDKEVEAWRRVLLRSESFMSLAYELAAGFLLIAVIDLAARSSPQLLKFSYNSYVLATGRDRRLVQLSHLWRWLRNRSRDAIDPVEWTRSSSWRQFHSSAPMPADTGRFVLSTLCEEAPEGLRQPASQLASALATIRGLSGSQTIRLRPSGVVVVDGFPAGHYTVCIEGRSGFEVDAEHLTFTISAGEVTRRHIRTRQTQLVSRVTKAPSTIGSPSSAWKAVARGTGWRSKPLAIRVRSGEGGSYHCQFKGPPGLHITRARLISNLEGNTDGRVEDARAEGVGRPHDVDMVLKSREQAHLYGRAKGEAPATGYVLLNLRPRIETIIRPAFITAIAAAVVLLFITYMWVEGHFTSLVDEDKEIPWALLAVLLAGPGALAAYVAQAVASRVTNAMLWGLRLLALVPTILTLIVAGVMVRYGSHEPPLWVLCVPACLAVVALLVTHHFAEHPPEQRVGDYRQGRGFEQWYAAKSFDDRRGDTAQPVVASPVRYAYAPGDDDDPVAAMRDRMLERIGGMTHATRRVAFGERWFHYWEREVPPALYFDSAESPAIFIGLATEEMARLSRDVRAFVEASRQ